METDNWTLFEEHIDRVLQVWRKHHNKDELPATVCIQGFLNDANSDFVNTLLKL